MLVKSYAHCLLPTSVIITPLHAIFTNDMVLNVVRNYAEIGSVIDCQCMANCQFKVTRTVTHIFSKWYS